MWTLSSIMYPLFAGMTNNFSLIYSFADTVINYHSNAVALADFAVEELASIEWLAVASAVFAGMV